MSSIHFVGGEKGGVGKSVLARLLCQWLIDHSERLCALDADPSTGALMRGYASFCHSVDLSLFESADQIMDRALGIERQVVVDLPAKSLRHLLRWMEDGDVVALAKQAEVRLVFWQVTDGSFHSVCALEDALLRLDSSVEVVIVCNQRWCGDFSQLENATEVQRVRERGGRIIKLPVLDPKVMYKIEQLGNDLSVAHGRGSSCAHSLSPMEQQRAALWLAQAYLEVAPILLESTGKELSSAPSGYPALHQEAPHQEAPHQEALRHEALHDEATATDPLATGPSTTGPSTAGPSTAGPSTAGPSTAGPSTAGPSTTAPEVEPGASEPGEGPLAAQSSKERPVVRTVWNDGPHTWTEVGEGYRTYHVRYR